MAVQTTSNTLVRRRRPDPPTAKPPQRSVLASLTEYDRELLAQLLTEPSDFTDHPDLHRRGAQKAIFGARVSFARPRGTRFLPPSAVIERSPTRGSTIPTLTTAQECALFLRLNYARMRVKRLFEDHAHKRLTATATRELLAWRKWALDFRALIVRMNMPLVLAMAKRTRLNSIDFNELISEGNMALLRSVAKFDCGRGFKFSTYSCRAILKSFSRVAMRVSRYRGRFPAEFDPALEADNSIETKRQAHEEDCVDELKSILVKNLADLSDVERTVIRERFALTDPGLEPDRPKTLEQVGTIIGVTKERVRQIQNKALKKIRETLEESYLAA